MPFFTHDGLKLHYVEQGEGPPIILLHGLLWSSRLFVRLRRELNGFRVILLNVRGHGESDRPTDPDAYCWEAFAGDVFAAMDHLGLERAIVGGLSLGANISLEAGMRAPERCAGLIVEMPVLERGHRLATFSFSALACLLELGGEPLRTLTSLLGRVPVPRAVPELAALRDVLALDPVAGAAVLRGLVGDDKLPDHDPARLDALTMPTLVIGHHNDALHAIDDSRDLAARLPRGRLVEASSILEFRFNPRTLARHIRALADECAF